MPWIVHSLHIRLTYLNSRNEELLFVKSPDHADMEFCYGDFDESRHHSLYKRHDKFKRCCRFKKW